MTRDACVESIDLKGFLGGQGDIKIFEELKERKMNQGP